MKKARDPELRARFGGIVRDARHHAQITQEELAARAGLDVSFVSRVERGLQAPSLEALVALAAALGVRPHQLVRAVEGPAPLD